MPLPPVGWCTPSALSEHSPVCLTTLQRQMKGVGETNGKTQRVRLSVKVRNREGLRRDRESFREQHLIASCLITACDVVLDVKKPKATFLGLKREQEQCVTYPPLPAQPPPTEVQPYTPSLSAAPESFPTMSPPGRLHAHGATHAKGNENMIRFRRHCVKSYSCNPKLLFFLPFFYYKNGDISHSHFFLNIGIDCLQ